MERPRSGELSRAGTSHSRQRGGRHSLGNPFGSSPVTKPTDLFHEIPDAFVVLQRGGVYRQAKVYRRGAHLFAAYAGGFVRLSEYGTSVPHLLLDGCDLGFAPDVLPGGRWAVPGTLKTVEAAPAPKRVTSRRKAA